MKIPLHTQMTNQEIARVLQFISGALDLEGANRFRVRAYDTAADAIESYPQELRELFDQKQSFEDIPGVGKTIAEKLTQLFTEGDIPAFQKYVSHIPAGVWALVPVHGLGIKRGMQLAIAFDLSNADTAVAELITNAKQGQVAELDGWGEKSQADLINQLDHHTHVKSERIPYKEAKALAEEVIGHLIENDLVDKAQALGSLRREVKTVGDIDIGVLCQNMHDVKKSVKSMKIVKSVVVSGSQLIRLFLTNGVQVDIKAAPAEEWGSFLQHFTGSKEHNIALREFALSQNLSLSEHGITDTTTKEITTFSDETSFYNYLGLDWIEPIQRTGKDEIKLAKVRYTKEKQKGSS